MPPPILRDKQHKAPSVFRPGNLLREARRQRNIPPGDVPAVTLLDPDGDILRYLRGTGAARRSETWACYHSELFVFERLDQPIGIIGCAVGAPYAVLLSEQLFASGARLVVSITSSGQLAQVAEPPYYVLVDHALRDEGTSYHYLPPSDFSAADPQLIARAATALDRSGVAYRTAATWTTDAPYRETEALIERGKALGLAAIEMESAALYAFAQAKGVPVLCFAHVTNTMAVDEEDFEKGAADGAIEALSLVDALLAGGLDALLGEPPTKT